MTCRNCIHFSNCAEKEETPYMGKDIACNNVESLCKFFLNKDIFIKVPCAIGDTIYIIKHCKKEIIPMTVYQIELDKDNIWIRADCGILSCVRPYTDFCYTLEDAEATVAYLKTLEERNN